MSSLSNSDLQSTLAEWLSASAIRFTQPGDRDTICKRGSQLLLDLSPISEQQLTQGIAVASELVPTTTDPTLIMACLIQPLLRHLPESDWPEKLSEYPQLKRIAQGVRRMKIREKIEHQKTADRLAQSNELRKMLLAMVDDARVVIIKLCEQAAEIRALHKNPDPNRRWQAEMGLHVYATLANRLGLGQLKWVLEDLSFRYLEPDTYKEISKGLHQKRAEREAYIVFFKDVLQKLLDEKTGCHNYQINGRAKHIYSIYRKSKRKQHSYAEINDATALRILLPTIADCYDALGAIHAEWDMVPGEFDDYISNPKPNGYRSLHTVVHGPKGVQIEIQIRTYDMHEEAELGVAAHWKYKEVRSSAEQNTSNKINWLQNLLSWHEEIDTDDDKSLYRKVFQNRVYVFTPNNKVIDLPPGATPLDFAYHIHTDIGHRCTGAKVNGRIVPLTYQLMTGDQVQILTQKNASPSRDWMSPRGGYLVSKHALSKVKNHFRKEFHDEYVKQGQEIWDRHFQQEKISKEHLHELVARFNFQRLDELYCALGSNDIHIRTITNKLRLITGVGKELESTKTTASNTTHNKQSSAIVIEGASNLLTQLARCCHPIPGDEVAGYITKSQGVSIHRHDCPNMLRFNTIKPERVVEAQWGLKKPDRFAVGIDIISHNDAQTDKKIVSYIIGQDVVVTGHSSRINRSESSKTYQYQLRVTNLEQLNQLMNGLRGVSGVKEVLRA